MPQGIRSVAITGAFVTTIPPTAPPAEWDMALAHARLEKGGVRGRLVLAP